MSPDQKKKRGGARLQKAEKPPKEKKEKQPKGPKKPLTSKQKVLRVLYIIATVLAAIVVVLFIAYKILVVKPELPTQPTRQPQPSVSLAPGESPKPQVSSDRKDNYWTFLVVGLDTGGGGNTDTILLASYDIPNQKLNVMSLPRDTLVNIPYDIKKLNAVYNYGGAGEDGIDYLKEEIAQLVGFTPDFTVTVKWKAVGELVDAIDGVYFDVPRTMDYDDPTQNLHIHVKKGYQLLDGDKAMQVVRFREGANGYADGDLGRIKTQQAFLKAVVEQCLQFKNVTKIGELAQVFFDNVTTNLTVNNLAWFAQMAILGTEGSGSLSMDNVNFYTMPWVSANNVYSRTYHNYPSYVAPDVDALVDLVNESFNPYVDDLRKDELDIMYTDKSGNIYSTTGKVEDTKYTPGGRTSSGNSSGGGKTDIPDGSTEPPVTSAGVTPTPLPSASPDPDASPSPSTSPGTSPTPSPSSSPSGGNSGGDTRPSPSPTPSPSVSPGEGEAVPSPTPQLPTDDPEPTPTPEATPSPTPTPVETPEPEVPDGPPEGIPF